MFWDFWTEEFDEKILIKLGFSGACVFCSAQNKKMKILNGEKITDLKKIKDSDFLLLVRPNENIQKIAIKQCLVDGINSFVKYPLIKDMAEKGIALVVSFNDLLNSGDKQKTIALMKQSVKLAKRYKTPIVIVSGAKNKWELRGTGELIAFGELLGLQRNEAKAG
jgi:RNase P/RNase MRP subunit p30